ncbi:MAG: DUF5110 domain-containing protein [Ruminococcaceae bacterium]|nr:DUF5110 domain-containing protein [Oscillospiraceae bacterium]
MKKVLAFFILFALFIFSATAVELDSSIDSAEELLLLMNTPSAWSGDYTLSADIDLESCAGQTAIGTAQTPFSGSFDGKGHSIKGIKLENSTLPAFGLFGYVDAATIKNFTTYGAVSSTEASGSGVDTAGTGSIVGCAWGKTTLENLTNYCTVSGVNKVGGIVGGVHSNSSTGDQTKVVRNLKNYGNVSGQTMVGGIVARAISSSQDIAITYENLYNAGDINITVASGNYYGGIVALVSSNASPVRFVNCQNDGDMTTPGRTGGIVGFIRNYSTNAEKLIFKNCINNGSITASGGYVGGIMSYCGNSGTTAYRGTFENCYSAGKIVASATNYIEPIGAVIRNCEVIDCFYASGVGGAATHGILVTEEADLASRLTTGEGWIIRDGVPELAEYHTHVLGEYVSTNSDGHYKTCYCGYETAKEEHDFEDTICTVCGASSCKHDGGKTFKSTKIAATCIAGGTDIYTCDKCGYDFEVASEKDKGNHDGSIVLSATAVSGKASYVCSGCGYLYLSRSENDVYVSVNGVSDFTVDNIATVGSINTPFANFTDAMMHAAAIASKGITVNIHVVDTASVPAGYVSPEYDGSIVISGGVLHTANQFSLGGALTVENIKITPSKSTVFEARGNKIVMGEGIIMGNTTAMYVVGGWDSHFSSTGDVPSNGYYTDVTVRSGKYSYVSGGNRDMKAEYRGEINLTAGATATSDTLTVTKILCTASLGDDYATEAKLTLTIDGSIDFAGTGVLYVLSGSQRGERSNFDADIFLKGKISNYIGVRYHGRYTADLYVDTSIDGIDKTVYDIMQGEAKLYPIGNYEVPDVKDTAAEFGEKGIHSFTFGDVRLTVLSDTVVRVEENLGEGFVDKATLTVPNREKFGGACVASGTDGDTAIIKTAELIINLPKENASADDVKIFDKDGSVLFDFYNSYMHGFYSSLPEPANTPDVYVLVDNGIIPAGAMVYSGNEEKDSGWTVSENIDYYVVATNGDSAKLRRDFVTLTGSTSMSDIKFYGSWYSRWSKFTAEEKLAMIKEYRDRGIPLDVIIIDTEWRSNADGTGYETNSELYPDMEGFLADAEEAGVYVLFNDHTHNTSSTILTPAEFKWQCANIKLLMEMGLDGWWYDRNWSYTIKSPYTNVLYSTLGQVLYNDTMADYHNGAKRVLMLTNADWLRHGFIEGAPSVIGHRYGMQWSGDIYGDSLQLGREIENTVVSGVVGGSPYISADLGGFRNNDTVSENAFIRWMQFGAFASALRVHSDINPKNPHYPWSYTDVAETIVRNYFNMRYHLMPYTYALAYENYESGMPLIRRLDFHYPEYEESKDNTQYLLGRDILVAPYNGNAGDGTKIVPSTWLKNSKGESGLDAAYYDVEGIAKDKYFDGIPAYTETVAEINNFWDQWGPNGVGTDHFAARYTGTITPEIDCYIGLVVDDGGRIYINGELWSGTWSNKFADAEVNTEKHLKAGETYDVVVEYYEASAKAQLYFVYDEVTESDESTRSVFIPDGEWIDVFTGEVIAGPKTISVTKDVYSSPIYVRKGAVILTAAVASPLTNADWQNVSINLYGLGEGSATIYEDDGVSEGYLDGDCRSTDISASTVGEITTVTISAVIGGFETDYSERNVTVRVHSDTPIKSALVNGKTATVTKVEKDAAAVPFADSGAAPLSDVYEISFVASLADEHTVLVSTSEETLKPTEVEGDVNCDGIITIADVLAIIKAVLNNQKVPKADLNGDGIIDLVDVIKVMKLASK